MAYATCMASSKADAGFAALQKKKSPVGSAKKASKAKKPSVSKPKKARVTSKTASPVRTFTKAFSITDADLEMLRGFMKDITTNAIQEGRQTRSYNESFALRFAIRVAQNSPNLGTDIETIRKELESEDGRKTRHLAS